MNGALDHSDQPDPDAIKMFVGQIPRSWSEKELKELFEPYGAVYQINVLRDRSQNPPQSKGTDRWGDARGWRGEGRAQGVQSGDAAGARGWCGPGGAARGREDHEGSRHRRLGAPASPAPPRAGTRAPARQPARPPDRWTKPARDAREGGAAGARGRASVQARDCSLEVTSSAAQAPLGWSGCLSKEPCFSALRCRS